MDAGTWTFLEALFTPCEQGCLTFSAIHPDGCHPTPSRHVPVCDRRGQARTVDRLTVANEQGWGAYVAVATRRTNLGRWRRGGQADLLALPALFVDVDSPTSDTLERLRRTSPEPSCITFTGGGYHAYWWLAEPLTDFIQARQLLQTLSARLDGDRLSPAQSLRLPGTRNTKPGRDNALCEVVFLREDRYRLDDFGLLTDSRPTPHMAHPPAGFNTTPVRTGHILNPILLDVVIGVLLQQGYRRSGDWLSGPCLFPHHHRHGDHHASFGFNARTGYGHCFRCGSLLLKDLCRTLGIRPADHGGLLI